MWRDEVDLPDRCFGHVSTRTVVEGHRHHDLARAYAIVDNIALRAHLADGLDVRAGRASASSTSPGGAGSSPASGAPSTPASSSTPPGGRRR